MNVSGTKKEKVIVEVSPFEILDAMLNELVHMKIGDDMINENHKYCSMECTDYHKGEYGFIPKRDATLKEIGVYNAIMVLRKEYTDLLNN